MDEFDGDLSDYTLIEQEGASWFISNTNNAGRQAPELEFSSGSAGSSFLILNEFFDLNPDLNPLSFNYSFDLSYGTFTIGVVYSLDEGNTWSVIWQQVVTDDIPAGEIIITVPGENYVKLALFSNNNSSSFGEWYVDDLILNSPLSVPTPPAQIRALASHDSLKVSLNWVPGNVIDPASGYRIQRKNGFPQGNSSYQTIAEVGPAVLSIEDTIVQLNTIYTYRILETSWPGYVTTWSNEATAYVPPIIPVELQNFYAELSGNNVKLTWLTITETNNLGFEIQRRKVSGIDGQNEWMKTGFIKGYGTTTEIQNYYYTDKNLVKGIYQYRLKQIDFNRNFEYSNSINVTVDLPKEFYLSQNYPNPFNPETEIEYTVPNDSKVSIKIFDILGNEIATLINDEKPAGNYSLTWNAVNLPSGIYFYELRAVPTGRQAGGFIQTKKMVLLK
ncbi:MAG TPA: T9SS type A sorting domain-containing protein [Ignavibacteriaceae bacterium]|nr:T9SS type A sorting domain-containing protein [Ignavibacteriaceae bacterium]